MFLAPFKAVYSVKFYLRAIKKPGLAPLGFLAYLFVITAVLIAGATQISAKPRINYFVDRLAYYTPDITVQNGKITVNDDNPLTIAPEELKGYKIHFNTGSAEPVYPTQMEQSQTILSVNANTAYFNLQDNFQQTKVSDNEVKFNISGDEILKHKKQIATIVLWALIIMLVVAQLFKIPFMIVLGFITASVFNGATRANMSPVEMLKLSCYMQAPAALVYILTSLSPVKPMLAVFIYIAVFSLFSYLVFSAYIAEAANDTADKA